MIDESFGDPSGDGGTRGEKHRMRNCESYFLQCVHDTLHVQLLVVIGFKRKGDRYAPDVQFVHRILFQEINIR